MKKISRFDLIMIIVFVVITLIGGGVWWYMSGQLDATKAVVSSADSDFNHYSGGQVYLPTPANIKTLQNNIDLMQTQLDPVIHNELQAPADKLPTAAREDTVQWKHRLDEEVARLNAAAKVHGVNVPPNFYYGFSRYLNQNPSDEQTLVLSKQLLGVEEMANIFINAPVRSIATFRRTYEEDPASANSAFSSASTAARGDTDMLPGRATTAPGGVYVAYPFEIEFATGVDGLRKVVDDLQKSPYVFVVRSLVIQNSRQASPQIADLDKLGGEASHQPVADTAPGAVGASRSSLGPQFLFGDEYLHVKVRIDMIEWKGISSGETEQTGTRLQQPKRPKRRTQPGRRRRGLGRRRGMKKSPEPIVLTVALSLLILTAAGLAHWFPSWQDITGVSSTNPTGKNPPRLDTEDVQAKLADWTKPADWTAPENKHRLFVSDGFLFYPSLYPDGNYLQKNDGTARTPGGVLISWYQKYAIDFTNPNVDVEDPDNDGFSNIVEFKNDPVGVRVKAADCDGTKSTNPLDPQSHPAYLSRLRLQKYDSKPFRITFRGYEQIGGVETYQIYLADVPSSEQPGLKKTGDKLGFQNYVVGAFHQNIVQKVNAATHTTEQEDDSTLELDRPDIGFSIQLPYRKEVDSPDSTADFVMLMPSERDKVVKVQRGQTFTPAFLSTPYLLIDVNASSAVIQNTTTKEKITVLLLDPKEWDEVPAAPPAPPPTPPAAK